PVHQAYQCTEGEVDTTTVPPQNHAEECSNRTDDDKKPLSRCQQQQHRAQHCHCNCCITHCSAPTPSARISLMKIASACKRVTTMPITMTILMGAVGGLQALT